MSVVAELSGRPFTVTADVLAMNWGRRKDGASLWRHDAA